MAQADCPNCGGTGWKIVEGDRVIPLSEQRVPEPLAKQAEAENVKAFALDSRPGANPGGGLPRLAVPCDCTVGDRHSRILERARLPKRYQHCNFESFDTDLYEREPKANAWNQSLEQAKIVVQGFARDYPVGVEHGLLLMGSCGVGKTHLAVAALTEIVLRGHTGLFYDYRELLKQIQDSYNPESNATEMGVLEPVLKTEVLLLDDLGSSKPSLWALETVGHILNTRYNEHRVTLLTTNFLDSPATPPAVRGASARPVAVEDSLTDRVGARIRSRLYEMCRTVEIHAPDYRKEIRQASRFHA
ncbi:MAG TPA: ATP-binding protein [Candidatus Acidoferrales bacterium]|nr:ATP-binding protein [Candidatus Acidoferrales bacterium]